MPNCWVVFYLLQLFEIKPYKKEEVGKKDIVDEPYKNPKNDDFPLKKQY